ncbi:MAG: pyrroline-5-carboxylate reductase [Serpentinimonas sp.]|jgi:pyrroline-5-carboxylate reductase|nr:pyrroline-5-carboxylate reductase [Serpentinimonas sp.]
MTSLNAPSPVLPDPLQQAHLAFIGGGNMASAIVGGLLRQGMSGRQITVVEPYAPQREKLASQWADTGMQLLEAPGPALGAAGLVVWAVKPQTFRDAALAAAPHAAGALHLSVAAGITSQSMAGWLGTQRIVRTMPNTPALVGLGMTGMFARDSVSEADRALAEAVVATTGASVWLPQEADLDAVTALSGSGPAYVFYFLEAMRDAGVSMGLSAETATRLAIGTFVGASHLAQDAIDPPEVLRERVTSKGGTTYAALTALQADGVRDSFMQAIRAAQARATQMGAEFGAS